MKNIITKLKYIIVLLPIIIFTSCNDQITDFGFDGSISGKIVDQSGNIVSGDITSSDFRVLAHGERDDIPMELRVKGDGTFANTHLYPQAYQVWVDGPVISSEEVTADLDGGNAVTLDFIVTPFLSIPPPQVNGSATSSEVSLSYSITENQGHVVELRQIYASTVPHPTNTTGTGSHWHTQTVVMDENEGIVTITGLQPDTQYFIRIGARAEGASARNFSDQTIVTTTP